MSTKLQPDYWIRPVHSVQRTHKVKCTYCTQSLCQILPGIIYHLGKGKGRLIGKCNEIKLWTNEEKRALGNAKKILLYK